MKIRVVQMNIVETVADNILNAIYLARSKKLNDVDILFFPELFTTGYQLERLNKIAHRKDDSLFKDFRTLARKYSVHIILGSIAYKNTTGITNTSFIINNKGKIISSYSKIHLFRLMNEQNYFKAGEHSHIFKLNNTKMSSIICYDLRFPELSRKVFVKSQVYIVFVPMEWPKLRMEVFRSLLKARAIENQCFFLSCNRVGEENGVKFTGHSLLADPYGNICYEMGEKEDIMDMDLDFTVVKKVRKQMNCLLDRKENTY